jgi:outer membrane protein OmpA-like peptidoglycan-associated protein
MRASTPHWHALSPIAAWLLCTCLAGTAVAQTATPSAENMIEQLKTPRSRGLRNLQVEEAGAKEIPEAPRPQFPGASASSPDVPAAESGAVPPPPPSLTLLIQFDFDSARVRPQSQQALRNLSRALQSMELRASRFLIEGHTDAKGNADYNQNLSELRALSVRTILQDQGVASARLLTIGKGSSELVNRDQPYAPENRRVKIVNLD